VATVRFAAGLGYEVTPVKAAAKIGGELPGGSVIGGGYDEVPTLCRARALP
jgi:hypothetical protein